MINGSVGFKQKVIDIDFASCNYSDETNLCANQSQIKNFVEDITFEAYLAIKQVSNNSSKVFQLVNKGMLKEKLFTKLILRNNYKIDKDLYIGYFKRSIE